MGRRKKRRGAPSRPAAQTDTSATRAPEPSAQSDVERRLGVLLTAARRAVIESFEAADRPGDPAAMRRQPALQAETLGLEAQLFAARARALEAKADDEADKAERRELRDDAQALRKRARQASADAIKWQIEGRHGLELDLLDTAARLEQVLGQRSGLAAAINDL